MPRQNAHNLEWSANELTVGQVSTRSGVSVSALHFYEREGLIASRRTGGNQRRYARETLRRIAFIRIAQRVGIPLGEIKLALDSLPHGRTPTPDDWKRLSEQWRDELDERILRLQQLRDQFTGCMDAAACRLPIAQWPTRRMCSQNRVQVRGVWSSIRLINDQRSPYHESD